MPALLTSASSRPWRATTASTVFPPAGLVRHVLPHRERALARERCERLEFRRSITSDARPPRGSLRARAADAAGSASDEGDLAFEATFSLNHALPVLDEVEEASRFPAAEPRSQESVLDRTEKRRCHARARRGRTRSAEADRKHDRKSADGQAALCERNRRLRRRTFTHTRSRRTKREPRGSPSRKGCYGASTRVRSLHPDAPAMRRGEVARHEQPVMLAALLQQLAA